MKLITAALLILVAAAVMVQAVSSTAFDFGSRSQASDPDAKYMERMIAESLHNIASISPPGRPNAGTMDQNQRSNGSSNGSLINGTLINETSTNGTSTNGTSTNSSAASLSINGTSNNSSMLNGSANQNGSGGAAMADSLSASSQQLGASSKGQVKGFWGIQANQHVMGQKDVKSHMFLSGTFDVDKTVKFSEPGSAG